MIDATEQAIIQEVLNFAASKEGIGAALAALAVKVALQLAETGHPAPETFLKDAYDAVEIDAQRLAKAKWG